mmetsp:Transcript_29176/g.38366  ORF Transcript_29176/g.38366 Transcript_29176/m.38366 type:complete len:420 (-) Transcript_29176:238-1497(-)
MKFPLFSIFTMKIWTSLSLYTSFAPAGKRLQCFGLPKSSERALNAEPPIIEIVLNKYAPLGCDNLAQGVCRWGPPGATQGVIKATDEKDYKYGDILGDSSLRAALADKLAQSNGLNLAGQEIMVTAGGNQAFVNVALALCDPGDKVVVVKPFYFSHLVALQLAGTSICYADFQAETLLPDMGHLRSLVTSDCKMLVLTSPNNPSGAVIPKDMLLEIVDLCKEAGAWLVLDEAYEHFTFGRAEHFSPCANSLEYDGIVHLYTMSKSYGMAGWRVGYMLYPSRVSNEMQKIQDTLPTHASIKSQAIAHACLTSPSAGFQWVRSQVNSLHRCREAMWNAVKDTGTVKTEGAFYFLVKIPSGIEDMEAVDFLATKHGVMVLPGSAFGAPGYLRASYGSLPEEKCLKTISKLKSGLKGLAMMKK